MRNFVEEKSLAIMATDRIWNTRWILKHRGHIFNYLASSRQEKLEYEQIIPASLEKKMNRGPLCCRHLLQPSVLVWRLTSCQWGLESGNLVAPILIWEMHLVCNGTYQSSPPLLKNFFFQGQTLQFQLRERRYSINSLMRATLGGRHSNSGQSIERISDMAWVLDPRWKKKSEFFGNKLEKQSFMFQSLHPSSLPSPIEQTLKRKQIYQTVPVQVCTSPLANLKQKYGGEVYNTPYIETINPSLPSKIRNLSPVLRRRKSGSHFGLNFEQHLCSE